MTLRERLFERGQGWLRWGTEKREAWEYDDNACASYCAGMYLVAPPLRRLALYLRQWFFVPRAMLVGFKWPEDAKRYRFSWEEAQPIWPSDTKDRK